jgi:transketolase
MRNKFSEVLYALAKQDTNIYLVAADISPAGSMEKFRSEYPSRFINVGVAEQAMVGMAAGLAMAGFTPFVYTIATFALYRPFEMIRDDLCYQNLSVTIVGMGAGLVYSTLGGTHHAFEDIAIASAIPNMQIIAPSDSLELEEAIKYCALQKNGPIYLRIGKSGEKTITEGAVNIFEFGKLRPLIIGRDVCLITYGPISSMVKEVVHEMGENYSMYLCHTLKPIDINGLKNILAKYKKILTVEEHVPHGGLSSRVKEIAWDVGFKGRLTSMTLKDEFIHCYGSHEDILNAHDLSKNKIKLKLLGLVNEI